MTTAESVATGEEVKGIDAEIPRHSKALDSDFETIGEIRVANPQHHWVVNRPGNESAAGETGRRERESCTQRHSRFMLIPTCAVDPDQWESCTSS